jgi:hypothetical protein
MNFDPWVSQLARSELIPWVSQMTEAERDRLAEGMHDGLQGELWL